VGGDGKRMSGEEIVVPLEDLCIVVEISPTCATVGPQTGNVGLETLWQHVVDVTSFLTASVGVGGNERREKESGWDGTREDGRRGFGPQRMAIVVALRVGSRRKSLVVLEPTEFDDLVADSKRDVSAEIASRYGQVSGQLAKEISFWRASLRDSLGKQLNGTKSTLADVIGLGMWCMRPQLGGHILIISEDGGGASENDAASLVGPLCRKRMRISAVIGGGTDAVGTFRLYSALRMLSGATGGEVVSPEGIEAFCRRLLLGQLPGPASPTIWWPWRPLGSSVVHLSADEAEEHFVDRHDHCRGGEVALTRRHLTDPRELGRPPLNTLNQRVLRQYKIPAQSVSPCVHSRLIDGFVELPVSQQSPQTKDDFSTARAEHPTVRARRKSDHQLSSYREFQKTWRVGIYIIVRVSSGPVSSDQIQGSVTNTSLGSDARVQISLRSNPVVVLAVKGMVDRERERVPANFSDNTVIRLRELAAYLLQIEGIDRCISDIVTAKMVKPLRSNWEIIIAKHNLTQSRWHLIFDVTSMDFIVESENCHFTQSPVHLLVPNIDQFSSCLLSTGWVLVSLNDSDLGRSLALLCSKYLSSKLLRLTVASFAVPQKMRTEFLQCLQDILSAEGWKPLEPSKAPCDLYGLPLTLMPYTDTPQCPQPAPCLALRDSFFRSRTGPRYSCSYPLIAAIYRSRLLSGFLAMDSEPVEQGNALGCRLLKITPQGSIFYSFDTISGRSFIRECPTGPSQLNIAVFDVRHEDHLLHGFYDCWDKLNRVEAMDSVNVDWLFAFDWPTRVWNYCSFLDSTVREKLEELDSDLLTVEAGATSSLGTGKIHLCRWGNDPIVVLRTSTSSVPPELALSVSVCRPPISWVVGTPSESGPRFQPVELEDSSWEGLHQWRLRFEQRHWINFVSSAYWALVLGKKVTAQELSVAIQKSCEVQTISLLRNDLDPGATEFVRRAVTEVLSKCRYLKRFKEGPCIVNGSEVIVYFLIACDGDVTSEPDGNSPLFVWNDPRSPGLVLFAHLDGAFDSIKVEHESFAPKLIVLLRAAARDACIAAAGQVVLSLTWTRYDLMESTFAELGELASSMGLQVHWQGENCEGWPKPMQLSLVGADDSKAIVEQFSAVPGSVLARHVRKANDASVPYKSAIQYLLRLEGFAFDLQLLKLTRILREPSIDPHPLDLLFKLSLQYMSDLPIRSQGSIHEVVYHLSDIFAEHPLVMDGVKAILTRSFSVTSGLLDVKKCMAHSLELDILAPIGHEHITAISWRRMEAFSCNPFFVLALGNDSNSDPMTSIVRIMVGLVPSSLRVDHTLENWVKWATVRDENHPSLQSSVVRRASWVLVRALRERLRDDCWNAMFRNELVLNGGTLPPSDIQSSVCIPNLEELFSELTIMIRIDGEIDPDLWLPADVGLDGFRGYLRNNIREFKITPLRSLNRTNDHVYLVYEGTLALEDQPVVAAEDAVALIEVDVVHDEVIVSACLRESSPRADTAARVTVERGMDAFLRYLWDTCTDNISL